MSALGPLGIGLSVVIGCFVLVLLAEIYYIAYSRRRHIIDPSREAGLRREVEERVRRSETRPLGLLNLLRWKRKPGFQDFASGVIVDDHTCSSNVRFGVEEATAAIDIGGLQPSPFVGSSELATKLFPFLEDCDILNLEGLQGLLGPPRLLFTIKEETKEDIDCQDTEPRNASRDSSEFLPHIDSGSITHVETPFVTPPLSPCLAARSGSPPLRADDAYADKEAPLLLAKPCNTISVDESSSSFSSSSSETSTPPSRRRLRTLLEETSSSSSSSSSPTPFTGCASWNRSFLDAFSEISPPASLLLHQNRVYPLETS